MNKKEFETYLTNRTHGSPIGYVIVFNNKILHIGAGIWSREGTAIAALKNHNPLIKRNIAQYLEEGLIKIIKLVPDGQTTIKL